MYAVVTECDILTRMGMKAIEDKDRATLIKVLQQNDPNGCYTDQCCLDEGLDCLSFDEAASIFFNTFGEHA